MSGAQSDRLTGSWSGARARGWTGSGDRACSATGPSRTAVGRRQLGGAVRPAGGGAVGRAPARARAAAPPGLPPRDGGDVLEPAPATVALCRFRDLATRGAVTTGDDERRSQL